MNNKTFYVGRRTPNVFDLWVVLSTIDQKEHSIPFDLKQQAQKKCDEMNNQSMTKLYSIEYQHTAAYRAKQTTSITQLAQWLEDALNDEHVVDASINLFTTVREDKKDGNTH